MHAPAHTHAPSHAPASPFAYDGLDDLTRAAVQQATAAIHERLQRTATDLIAIGERLLAVRERLPHGQFGPWLDAEFGWSEGHARKLMQVARAFADQTDHRDRFAPTALYLLAAPGAPEEARAEALARAEAGEPITPAVARAMIARYAAAPEPGLEPEWPEPEAAPRTPAVRPIPVDDGASIAAQVQAIEPGDPDAPLHLDTARKALNVAVTLHSLAAEIAVPLLATIIAVGTGIAQPHARAAGFSLTARATWDDDGWTLAIPGAPAETFRGWELTRLLQRIRTHASGRAPAPRAGSGDFAETALHHATTALRLLATDQAAQIDGAALTAAADALTASPRPGHAALANVLRCIATHGGQLR